MKYTKLLDEEEIEKVNTSYTIEMKVNCQSVNLVFDLASTSNKNCDGTNTLQRGKSCLLSTFKDCFISREDPQKYSDCKKWSIIFIAALSSMTGTMGAMIYMPGIKEITSDLDATLTGINGSIASYIIFLGIAPLFWASMSEAYGRKPAYILSILLSVIGSILCAVSKNISMFLIFRAVQACGTSSGQTLGGGVISDIIDTSKRGSAYGMFYVGSLLGPAIGPAIGGVLCHYLGWRWTFYFLAILSTMLLLLVIFFVPETLRKFYVDNDAYNQHSETTKIFDQSGALKRIHVAFKSMLVMLRDPTVVLVTAYNSIIFSSFYFLNPTISTLFQTRYNLNSWQTGLCYFVLGIGLMIGSIASGRYTDFTYRRLVKNNNSQEKPIPESRLRAAFPSFILIPAGYIIHGWTSEGKVEIYGPLIGIFVYALGQMFAFNPTNVYLVDSKPGRSASALAINNCFRFVAAAITTMFSSSFLNALGPGILFTVLTVVAVLNTFILLLVMTQGEKWRTKFEHRTNTAPT